MPCLLTSRHIHRAAISVAYRDVKVSFPGTLSSIPSQLRLYPDLGTLVRSLDLSDELGAAASPNLEKQGNPLCDFLNLTPLLQHFRIGVSFQHFLNSATLRTLLCDLKMIQSIDFSQCHSPSFALEFLSLCSDPALRVSPYMKSLSLHGCKDLPPEIFKAILYQLPRLQLLDVKNTQIPAHALLSIPKTARITHLNINQCDFLSTSEITEFLTTHLAVTLTLLSLEAATSQDVPGLTEDQVTAILSKAPSTLRSLNLKNSEMTSKHLPLLQKLSHQLTELTVGSHLRLRDIEALFVSPSELEAEVSHTPAPEARVEPKHHTVLSPLEEAVSICKLRSRSNSASFSKPGSALRYLDLSGMRMEEQEKLRRSVLFGTGLEIIEVSEGKGLKVAGMERLWRAVGWEMISEGRRAWFQRIT